MPGTRARAALHRAGRGRLSKSERAPRRNVPRGAARHEQARSVRARRHRLHHDRATFRPSGCATPAHRRARISSSPRTIPTCAALLRAIIARMVKYLQIDPYANAYTLDYRVWEQKFELDSLAYPTALAWSYWKTTGDSSIFTGDFSTMLDDVLSTMQREQNHPRDSRYTHKELPNDGRGNPVGYTGMIWTGFRPSDDACEYNFLIPSEMFAVVALGDMARDRARRLSQRRQGARGQGAARRGAARDSDLRPGARAEVRLHLRLRSRRSRPRDSHRRREHPEPARGAVLRLHRAERPLLREHAPLLALAGQSVVLSGTPGARNRQLSHAGSLGLAARAHHRRHDRDDRAPRSRTCSASCSPAIPATICCTSRSIPTIRSSSRVATSAGPTRSFRSS